MAYSRRRRRSSRRRGRKSGTKRYKTYTVARGGIRL